MKVKNKNVQRRLSIWAGAVAGVLTVPFFANFPWTLGDFVFAGSVLLGSATAYELVTMKMSNKNYRIAVGAAVAIVVFLIWGWAVA